MLKLAENLKLPHEAVTEVVGLLGARGSGKTTTASVLAEEMLANHLPVVIIDPTDAWFGLRSSKDGKADGYPITILGGDHADAPLEETAGKVLADLVAEEAPPLVLSLRLLSEAAKRRFVADFAERLYEKNRTALHVVIDEADEFAPQRITKGGERCFGAVDRIVRRGRSSGLGVTLISQRSAAISKDVLSQCSTLIAHRASHPRDLEPVLEWMKVHATRDQLAEVHGSIAKLRDGEAWVMSPEWLSVFGRFQMRNRSTFNSSATPRAGERRVVPKRLAPVDLAALQKRIAATIEKAKQDDPKHLRAEIAALKRDRVDVSRLLAWINAEDRTPPAQAFTAGPERQLADAIAMRTGRAERVEVPVLPEKTAATLVDAVEKVAAAARSVERARADLASLGAEITAGLARVRAQSGAAVAPVARESGRHPASAPRPSVDKVAGGPLIGASPRPESRHAPVANGHDKLAGPEQRILDALAELEALGVPAPARVQVAFLAGYSNLTSKGFANGIGALRSAGRIQYPGEGTISLTEAGRALAQWKGTPTSVSELHDRVCALLPGPERKVLRELLRAYPNPVDRTELAAAAGYTNLTSKGFANALGRCRSLGFIDYPGRSQVVARSLLFLE